MTNEYDLGLLTGWLIAKDAPKEIVAVIDRLGQKTKGLSSAPNDSRKKREMTSEQRAAAVERMAKARAAKGKKTKPRGRKPIISEEKLDLVRALVNDRKTEYEIAKELGCKPHNVTGFRRRHGILYSKSQSFNYKEDGVDIKRFPPEYADGAARQKSVRAQTATPINTRMEMIDD